MPVEARLRPIACGKPQIVCERLVDGNLRCTSTEPLQRYNSSLAQLFRAAVERNPGGLFLAERDAGGAWCKLTYGEARQRGDGPAPAPLERGLSPQRPGLS